jgi:HAE1 family hydrophobic/amphiphilic exporter-1
VSADEALKEALALAKELLPEGYRAVPTGSSQAAAETNLQLWGALLLGVVVAYMILASQFNSFIHPVTVLLAMPFSFTGAFGALLLFGQSLNIYSFIGLILLMGLVKKNSILLVDVTNQFRDQGLRPDEALRKACPLRLRPIIMTSMATTAGAIPAAAALGAGAETLRPMGLAIVGGMMVSTLMTLFVVPAAYSMLARFEKSRPVSTEPAAGRALPGRRRR